VRAARQERILGGWLDASPEDPVNPPPGYEEIQRQELSRLFGIMTRVRLRILPVGAALLAAVAFLDPTPWRRALLAVMVPGLAAFFVVEYRRFLRHGLRPRAIELNLGVAALGSVVLAAATGGIESPALLLPLAIAAILGLFVPPRLSALLVWLQIAAIWSMAAVTLTGAVPTWIPSIFGGGARAGHGDALVVTVAVLASLMALALRGLGRGVRRSFDAMLRRAVAAQADALRSHAERAEELTALSAEIAHELKNPLASVKGLAALLDGAVPAGKPAERLGVLRREVDRMQGILDEFLNFSRPLVPLALDRVDLAAVAREVGALHEGLAHERGVELALRAAPAPARCDPRKVKQLLINLVQNALDASPAGATVEIETGLSAGEARIRVLDRGRGLDPALGDRVFDPGVTTKPRGSGLGLTIARALARQHGGEVRLAPRAGGGAEAEIALPAAAPGAAGEAA
jgi:signal transduction histidine kinase